MRHPTRRTWVLSTVALLVIYVGVSSFFLLRASAGAMATSVGDLQEAQAQLFTNPGQAAVQFRSSSQAAETSLAGLRQAPWWSRLLTALPPFRWQVGMIKATHALASAGSTTADLVSSFPSFAGQPNGDLGQLLSTDSASYGTWYDAQRSQITLLEDQLGATQNQLDAIPAIAMVGQRHQFSHLQQGVDAARRTVTQVDQLSSGLEQGLDGDWVVIFPSSAAQPMLLTISSKNGRITGATIAADSDGLTARYLAARTDHPFWNELAPTLAPGKAGVIVMDGNALQGLLRLTGPITLPGVAGTKVDADSFAAAPPALDQLVPGLVSALSAKPGSVAGMYRTTGQAVRGQDLQIWSAQPGLEHTLASLLPLGQPPADPNWLLVDCGAKQTVSLQRVIEWWQGKLVQHISVDSPGSCAAYLPKDATVLSGGSATTSTSFQRVALSGKQLTWSLPLNLTNLRHLIVLQTPKTDEAHFHGLGFDEKQIRNLALPR